MARKTVNNSIAAIDSLVNHLRNDLPPLLMRHRWRELSEKHGLPLSLGRMQNLDSLGQGPESMMVGGRVAYQRESYLDWLRARMAE